MQENSNQIPETDPDAWLRLPWTEQEFKIRDAVDHRHVCGIPLYGPATGEETDPRLLIIPNGWTHERCTLCTIRISEEPEDEHIGFTNGDDWLCQNCYEEWVWKRRVIDAHWGARADAAARSGFLSPEATMAHIMARLESGE